MADGPVVVMDFGSNTSKIGLANEKYPRHIFRTVYGRYRNPADFPAEIREDTFVGDVALERRAELRIKYPVEYGIVTNWDAMEQILNFSFNGKLNINSEDARVFMAEHAMLPKVNREKMAQIMFETFNVSAYGSGNEASLSLFACGQQTGLVLTSGQNVSHMMTIYEGFNLPYTTSHLNIGGANMTYHLQELLGASAENIPLDTICDMKEKLCYVAEDFEKEKVICSSSIAKEEYYKLPDGRTMAVRDERFTCPEVYFRPELIYLEMPGVHDILVNTLRRADINIHEALTSNILLCGGSTMFPGMSERLVKELSKMLPHLNVNLCPHDPADRKYLSWMGGAVVASTSGFVEQIVTKDEYDEYGPSLVRRKCLY